MTYGKISDKQKRILEFIKDSTLKKGYPPTVREIGKEVNLKSTSSVHAHLASLENAGYIRRDPSKTRAIEILDEQSPIQQELTYLPMLGYVAAGEPIFAQENITDYFPIPTHRLPNKECFMLEVKGESMINIGLNDGDYVIVAKQNTASNGEQVVALVEDGATVKTFYKENGYIRLQPENDYMEPIILQECHILGKMIGALRFNR